MHYIDNPKLWKTFLRLWYSLLMLIFAIYEEIRTSLSAIPDKLLKQQIINNNFLGNQKIPFFSEYNRKNAAVNFIQQFTLNCPPSTSLNTQQVFRREECRSSFLGVFLRLQKVFLQTSENAQIASLPIRTYRT